MAWAIGGIYEAQDRVILHEFLGKKGAPIPLKGKESETIFDYFVSQDTLDWKLCTPEVWEPPAQVQFSQLLLPTLDSFRAELLLNFILTQPKNH